jgi:hypothetical protein
MSDNGIPRWKVDTADETCFYNSRGVAKSTDTTTAIYDYPGAKYEIKEERVIFCTFVIIDNKVQYKVKWSKEFNENLVEQYTAAVEYCNKLPQWTLKTLLEDYQNTSDNSQKTYTLPSTLDQQLERLDEAALNEESKADFLQPPMNWITRKKFPELFLQQIEMPTLTNVSVKTI